MAATSADQDHRLEDSMTSATEEKTPSQPGRPNGAHERPARHAGAWVESLRRSDVSRLWTELQRLVINHPLVRASYSAGLLVEEGDRGSAYLDLTQEVRHAHRQGALPAYPTRDDGLRIEGEISRSSDQHLQRLASDTPRVPPRAAHIDHHPSSANFRRVDNAAPRAARKTAPAIVDALAFASVAKTTSARRAELEQRAHIVPVSHATRAWSAAPASADHHQH